MTVTPPSPAEFLAQPSTDEDDQVEELSPLESIAASLRQFVTWIDKQDADDVAEKAAAEYLEGLEREYNQVQAQLDEVLAICRPSTSKLANAIRAAIEGSEAAPAEDPGDTPEPAGGDPS